MSKPKSNTTKYSFKRVDGRFAQEHILIAEKAFGRRLPESAVIHHADGNGLNNANSNLVICPDNDYHMLLHARQDALDVCGNASFKMCRYCKKWGAPESMTNVRRPHRKNSFVFYHKACNTQHHREYRASKRSGSYAT